MSSISKTYIVFVSVLFFITGRLSPPCSFLISVVSIFVYIYTIWCFVCNCSHCDLCVCIYHVLYIFSRKEMTCANKSPCNTWIPIRLSYASRKKKIPEKKNSLKHQRRMIRIEPEYSIMWVAFNDILIWTENCFLQHVMEIMDGTILDIT